MSSRNIARVLPNNQGAFYLVSGGDDNAAYDRTTENGYVMNTDMWLHALVTWAGPYWAPGQGYLGFGNTRKTGSITGNDALSLIGDLQERVNGHSWNALVSAAELPESLGHVLSVMSTLYEGYKQTKRGQFGDAARTFARAATGSGASIGHNKRGEIARRVNKAPLAGTDVADAWLSLSWGWLPMINDIYQAMQAYAKKREQPRLLKVRVKKTRKEVVYINVTGGGGLFPAPMRYSLEYRVRYFELGLVAELGLNDPLTVIWEKIPFSCVFDYFIPVGDYLAARSFIQSLSYSASSTEFSIVEGVRNSVPCNTCGAAYEAPHNSQCSAHGSDPATFKPLRKDQIWGSHSMATTIAKYVWMRRTGVATIAVPSPSLKTLEKSFSTAHNANMAALVYGFIAGAQGPSSSSLPQNSGGLRRFLS